MIILGLDPGPTHSALLGWNGECVVSYRFVPNSDLLDHLKYNDLDQPWPKEVYKPRPHLVIEKIESFGMAVGAETFETVWWSGRFAEAYGIDHVGRLGRKAVKLHLCHSNRATDSSIRMAILDRFGGKEAAIGKKAAPGPLYGVSGHLWAAFAVALTWHDQHNLEG